jgi:hypothetical protein
MTQLVTPQQAFAAMALFLERFYKRCDDMQTLLADLSIEADGEPLDPAAWDDWVAALEEVLRQSPHEDRSDG